MSLTSEYAIQSLLDICPRRQVTWLKDRSLTDPDNLPEPDLLANEIIENLEAGIESFREIYLSVK